MFDKFRDAANRWFGCSSTHIASSECDTNKVLPQKSPIKHKLLRVGNFNIFLKKEKEEPTKLSKKNVSEKSLPSISHSSSKPKFFSGNTSYGTIEELNDIKHLENVFFSKIKNEQIDELQLYQKKALAGSGNLKKEYHPLKDYLVQRTVLGRKIDDKNKLATLINGQQSIIDTKKSLPGGRGNVIPDMEQTNFDSLAGKIVAQNIQTSLISALFDPPNKKNEIWLAYWPDGFIEKAIDTIKDPVEREEILYRTATAGAALWAESGTCDDYSVLSAAYHASRLSDGLSVTRTGSSKPMDHGWTEQGGAVIDAWAQGPAILKEDANPVYESEQQKSYAFSLDQSSGKLLLEGANGIAAALRSDTKMHSKLMKYREEQKQLKIEKVKNNTWNYKNNKNYFNPMSVFNKEFIKKSKEALSILKATRLKLKTNEKSIQEAKEIISNERKVDMLLHSILEVGAHRDLGLNIMSAVSSISVSDVKQQNSVVGLEEVQKTSPG